MPDAESSTEPINVVTAGDRPTDAATYDWGMSNRMARIFPSGRTVMLACDHGYFQGPTTGLERIDLSILPMIDLADALMLTRGILRTTVPASYTKAVVMRASGGPSILRELSNERVAVGMDDAVRMNVQAVAVQVFIGGEHETESVHNLTQIVDAGYRVGMPVLGVTAVGRDLVRDSRYLALASRICAELGAQFVKTYFVDDGFEIVTSTCPVPIVVAGGKKVAELNALSMSARAMSQGAAGVDMGRNIFQSKCPPAMLAAVRGVVHEGLSASEAHELFQTLAGKSAAAPNSAAPNSKVSR